MTYVDICSSNQFSHFRKLHVCFIGVVCSSSKSRRLVTSGSYNGSDLSYPGKKRPAMSSSLHQMCGFPDFKILNQKKHFFQNKNPYLN